MKKYIKITKEVTEEMAVKKLKELWGKIYEDLLLCHKHYWILILNNYWDIYYTNNSEKELKSMWYEEIKLEPNFELWEQIWVNNKSEEDAIKKLEKDYCKYYYTWWKTKSWMHIVENDEWDIQEWEYIAKIPK